METTTEDIYLLQEGEILLTGATDKELTILCRTRKARIRKKYTDRIIRRQEGNGNSELGIRNSEGVLRTGVIYAHCV